MFERATETRRPSASALAPAFYSLTKGITAVHIGLRATIWSGATSI
jgi:hypothetical protein